jgi:hypothetical protein
MEGHKIIMFYMKYSPVEIVYKTLLTNILCVIFHIFGITSLIWTNFFEEDIYIYIYSRLRIVKFYGYP